MRVWTHRNWSNGVSAGSSSKPSDWKWPTTSCTVALSRLTRINRGIESGGEGQCIVYTAWVHSPEQEYNTCYSDGCGEKVLGGLGALFGLDAGERCS